MKLRNKDMTHQLPDTLAWIKPWNESQGSTTGLECGQISETIFDNAIHANEANRTDTDSTDCYNRYHK